MNPFGLLFVLGACVFLGAVLARQGRWVEELSPSQVPTSVPALVPASEPGSGKKRTSAFVQFRASREGLSVEGAVRVEYRVRDGRIEVLYRAWSVEAPQGLLVWVGKDAVRSEAARAACAWLIVAANGLEE